MTAAIVLLCGDCLTCTSRAVALQLFTACSRIERISFLAVLLQQPVSAAISLLPAVHVRCKTLEVLTEFLAPSETLQSSRIVDLATHIWSAATAVEVLELAKEILSVEEFQELLQWIRCHYPLIFLAYNGSEQTSEELC